MNKLQFIEDFPMLLCFQDFIGTIFSHFFHKQDHIDVFYILSYSRMFYFFGGFNLNFIYFLFKKIANAMAVHAAKRILEDLFSLLKSSKFNSNP